MIVHEDSLSSLLLHFGIGLIGTAVYRSVHQRHKIVYDREIKIDWRICETVDYKDQINAILDDLSVYEINNTFTIWSAGRVGFLSTMEEIDSDYHFFSIYLALTINTLRDRLGCRHSLFLIGSASALFEGHQHVTSSNLTPYPISDYGYNKYNQEIYAGNLNFDSTLNFRLSTVYSKSNWSNRMGLVNTLVYNSVRGRTTSIYGDISTVRDYILDEDVGEFISSFIGTELTPSYNYMLVSGKSTSLFEIIRYLESIINKRIYVNYASVSRNNSNISFSGNLIPIGFNVSDLFYTMRILYVNSLSQIHYNASGLL